MPSDRPAAELSSTGTPAAQNGAAVAGHRPPRKSQWRRVTHTCSRGSSEYLRAVQSSPELSSGAEIPCFLFMLCPLLPLSCPFSGPGHTFPTLSYVCSSTLHLSQSPASFFRILVCPHTLFPSFSCCPVPAKSHPHLSSGY